MRITSAKFVKSLTEGYAAFNTLLPEVALVGKSNVGKSSLINALAQQNKLAKVSKNPGKTKLVNYFLLNDAFYLVGVWLCECLEGGKGAVGRADAGIFCTVGNAAGSHPAHRYPPGTRTGGHRHAGIRALLFRPGANRGDQG